MRARFSSCIGTPVVCDSVDATYGQIVDILIHPDTGTIEGFYIYGATGVSGTPFLASDDIIRWGTQAHVCDPDAVYPLEERIRIAPLLEERRPVLGQAMRTQSGTSLGVCRDVQINTDSMRCEWLFPRKFWRWGIPVSLADVIEITSAAIIVRDAPVPVAVEQHATNVTTDILSQIPDVAAGMSRDSH